MLLRHVPQGTLHAHHSITPPQSEAQRVLRTDVFQNGFMGQLLK